MLAIVTKFIASLINKNEFDSLDYFLMREKDGILEYHLDDGKTIKITIEIQDEFSDI